MAGNTNIPFKWRFRIGNSLLLALILLVQFGCSEMIRRSDSEDGTIIRTYKAQFYLPTKTALSSEGDVSWLQGDQILYYCQDGGQLRTSTIAEDAVSATSSLTVDANAPYLTAIYGSSTVTNYASDGLTLSGVVTAEQPGTFIDGHVAVAKTLEIDSPSLLFYNLVSFITFSTNREDVAYVIFASNDDTALQANGSVDIHYDNNVPIASFNQDQGNSIKIQLSGAGLYYIATLPCTLQNGFTLSCYDANDNLIGTATGNNVLSVQRASIARLGLIDSHLVDINGIKLIGYDPDTNWDGTQNSNAGITHGMYGEDYNWDTNGNSGANINKGSYNGDSNWDSNGNSNANVGKDGYGNDSNWDTNNNSGGNLGINGYGNDTNWG